MEFKESCISSIFLHAIAVLLVAAVSQHQVRQVESLVITLSADTFQNTGSSEQAGVDHIQEVVSTDPDISVEEQAALREDEPGETSPTAYEKPHEVPEPAQSPEPPQIPDTALPGPVQDNMALARMHQIVFIHARAFVETTSQSIQSALRREIASGLSGGLNEGTAQITFYFDERGGIGEVWGSSDSESLKTLLTRIDWKAMLSPGDFRFKMNGLRVGITIQQGEPSLNFSVM